MRFGYRKLGGMPGADSRLVRDSAPVERGRVRVILDVEREGVPIRGSLSTAPGVVRRFHGWLELAAALEAARADALTPGRRATDLRAPDAEAVLRIS
jgi:hypothetical protein